MKNYLGLWRPSFLVSNSIGCLGGLLLVPEWDAASEIFSPSPLNILEGFFIIRLDTLHGEFVNAGTVLKGDVQKAETVQGFYG